jgi:uncharacterized membrane protein YraQ (UPF0718 family)
MNIVMVIIYVSPVLLGIYAYTRGDKSFQRGLIRGMEQLAIIVPRMICALIAAEFLALLIPTEFISQFLGNDAGIIAILIGSMTGLMIPSGPVISFSIAATFANAGASVPAVVAFLTAWSLFSAHRILIYEIPLMGLSFLRLRLLSVLLLPVLSGLITMGWMTMVDMLGT